MGRPQGPDFADDTASRPVGAAKTSFVCLFEVSLRELPQCRWTIVWFDAWENQRISPPWWMLYEKIYSTLTENSEAGQIAQLGKIQAPSL